MIINAIKVHMKVMSNGSLDVLKEDEFENYNSVRKSDYKECVMIIKKDANIINRKLSTVDLQINYI